jgi:hypothetical protein
LLQKLFIRKTKGYLRFVGRCLVYLAGQVQPMLLVQLEVLTASRLARLRKACSLSLKSVLRAGASTGSPESVFLREPGLASTSIRIRVFTPVV